MLYSKLSYTNLGSSLTFSAQGGRGKEKNAAAKNPVRPRKNTAEGGCGGNSAVFLQKIEAKPAALLGESRTQQKSFLFLLEEKIGRAQNQKCRENFFAGWRVVTSGGGLASLVGVLRKMGSDFFKQTPPFQIWVGSCLGASRLGSGFRQEIPRGFEIHRQDSRREATIPKRSLDCAKGARADERFSKIVGVSAVQFNHAIL